MAIVVVDEAVLSLTGYELADPLDVFYGRRLVEPEQQLHARFEHPLAHPDCQVTADEANRARTIRTPPR